MSRLFMSQAILLVCIICLLTPFSLDAASSPRHTKPSSSSRHSDIELVAPVKTAPTPSPYSDPKAPKLPNFNSIGNIYVSGVSSGAYMAGQLMVAYSSIINGAGMMAAGPWGCATGLLEKALQACTDDSEPIGLDDLITAAETSSTISTIDPVSNLQNAPIWIFHGQADATVKRSVSDANNAFFQYFGANVVYNNTTPANHAWISPLGANACTVSDTPYTSACGTMDPQYAMLSHLFNRSIQPSNQGTLTGSLTTFSQDFYSYARWDLPASDISMDSTGYIYVPQSCSSGTPCDVMMVLHGCEQSISLVGLDLIQQANMNQYADTNNFIVVYPQAIALDEGVVYNPKSCWDWWGYLADDELYANKGGYQNEVLMDMVAAIKAVSN